MTVFGGRRKSAPGILLAAVAGFSLLATTAANAVVTTTTDAVAFATALSTVPPAAASFGVTYDCDDEDPATLDDACPTAVSDGALAGFPTSGATFGIITSGDAGTGRRPQPPRGRQRRQLGQRPGHADPRRRLGPAGAQDRPAGRRPRATRPWPSTSGSSPRSSPSSSAPLQRRLHRPARPLDRHRRPGRADGHAPRNFALEAGDPISINAAGPARRSTRATSGRRTTGRRRCSPHGHPPPTPAHSLYLTLFDQGDAIHDSAVFVDNLRFENLAPRAVQELLAPRSLRGLTSGVTPLAGTPAFAVRATPCSTSR